MSKKIMILGANGMIGSGLIRGFQEFYANKYSICGVSRNYYESLDAICDKYLCNSNLISDYDQIISEYRPDYVINCIGIVSQIMSQFSKQEVIQLNALWPCSLMELAEKKNFRLIQISTDCVFDGASGCYNENATEFATDLYGTSKRLGEIHSPSSFTIRCSTIGYEIGNTHGLFEWFLSSTGTVKGFSNAFYNGICTPYLAKFVDYQIEKDTTDCVTHCVGHTTTKLQLLSAINTVFNLDKDIFPVEQPVINRTLSTSKETYSFDSWEAQLQVLKKLGRI